MRALRRPTKLVLVALIAGAALLGGCFGTGGDDACTSGVSAQLSC